MAEIFAVQAVFEDSSAWILARVVGMTNANITKASISEILLRVYDKESPPESTDEDDPAVIAARELNKDDVVFDTLQTDYGWDIEKDPDGWNVKIEILPADVPQGSKTYKFEIRFSDTATPTPRTWPVVVEVPTEGLYSS